MSSTVKVEPVGEFALLTMWLRLLLEASISTIVTRRAFSRQSISLDDKVDFTAPVRMTEMAEERTERRLSGYPRRRCCWLQQANGS